MAKRFRDLTEGQALDQTIAAQQATIRELHAMVNRSQRDIKRLHERCAELERLLGRACALHSGIAVASGLMHVR